MEKKVTDARAEGDHVVLRLEDGQELRWPADETPAASHVGATITIVTKQERERSRSELAADVLSELLRPSPATT